ncbi:conserved Plasmodium protein, unknown function [Plasmodium knowlesi strain H]|uniref:Uncharacterized protein n=3 Tax=Plasmodium knowlesi TaxID=5850 RepID=A0A5K1VEF8_PLAKH|nr:conserved Plasmodium protein, unknown function [Plasmodium knowlesi strain H]OTN64328.1 Uncharacterized protein PKNOH_S130201900 [Plasmodium knowlesi]CAA9989179.1 conserved Plasmodium protein, unknown function [Plasmodium knowlesi strain H]SBO27399.1 conserved Plasmodium protein, unknown function [Plasmodium knowlesi strain H]SBO27483.1 conserved Plasmodium protein, unknown function [Plasmodium knowlesi strain H]VVS78653.1 conserved Plasmodium protein, unknown function [Plasmodium knowlesi |eukprot:XP_002261526.1 hypothetical protein, conserved in Plasmodium species [Plasmodium knowlesi strain H]
MKRSSANLADSPTCAKRKKNKWAFHSAPFECKKNSYIRCRRNNFNNLGGLLLEKNFFFFNFLLSVKCNEEKKIYIKNKTHTSECATLDGDAELQLYCLSQGEQVFLPQDDQNDRNGQVATLVQRTDICEPTGEAPERQKEGNEKSRAECSTGNLIEKYKNTLLKKNFFFYIKNYIHHTLSHVDICREEKPNESFFEFYSNFKNKKKKIYFHNSEALLSDVYFDVSEVSDDSDYNFFYEKSNHVHEYDFEDGSDEGGAENEKVMEEPHDSDDVEKTNGNMCLIPNLSKKLNSLNFQKRHSILSLDDDKSKREAKERKFAKYACERCRGGGYGEQRDLSDASNKPNPSGEGGNVCLLQILISNLTKGELVFWAKIKSCIEEFLGTIKAIVLFKGIGNYVETPYIEIMDQIEKRKTEEEHIKYIKKKKKLVTLRKEQKCIKCLFERTINSVRISIKYDLTLSNKNFNYLFKDRICKYKKFIEKMLRQNLGASANMVHKDERSAFLPSQLNPIVFKNCKKKNYDFSLLIHSVHLELYGYIYMRDYLFFLLTMVEVYVFFHFNDINYTYAHNTDLFLDQILKNLFT